MRWVALVAALALVASSGGAGAGSATSALESTRCTFTPIAGARSDCYWLTVPERHARLNGRVIRLYVARFRSLSSAPRPDPLLFLAGGPGGSGIALASYVPNTVTPYLGKRDLIVLEQRGTRWSRPSLDCAAAVSEAACLRRLVAAGRDVKAYSSVESARDIEALRRAFGIEHWNVYGESYGTHVALTLLRDHPEHVRSVILDSSFALQVDDVAASSRKATLAFQRLVDGCAADAACRRTYGSVEQLLFGAFDRLQREPLHLSGRANGRAYDITLDGVQMLRWTHDAMYETELIPLLPRALKAASEGRDDPIWRAIAAWQIGVDRLVARGVHAAGWCVDEAPQSSRAAVAAVDRQYPTLAPYFSGEWILDMCDAIRPLPRAMRETRPVRSDVPSLVLAGHYDPVTPASEGRLAARTLRRSFFFEFPTLGHWVSPVSACARRIELAFLDEPTRRPDGSCLHGVRMRWALP